MLPYVISPIELGFLGIRVRLYKKRQALAAARFALKIATATAFVHQRKRWFQFMQCQASASTGGRYLPTVAVAAYSYCLKLGAAAKACRFLHKRTLM